MATNHVQFLDRLRRYGCHFEKVDQVFGLWKARERKTIEIIERQWIECESVVELTALRIRCYLDRQGLKPECVCARN
jgi:hypothetical protein